MPLSVLLQARAGTSVQTQLCGYFPQVKESKGPAGIRSHGGVGLVIRIQPLPLCNGHPLFSIPVLVFTLEIFLYLYRGHNYCFLFSTQLLIKRKGNP